MPLKPPVQLEDCFTKSCRKGEFFLLGRLHLLTDLAKKVLLNFGRAKLGAFSATMSVPDSQE